MGAKERATVSTQLWELCKTEKTTDCIQADNGQTVIASCKSHGLHFCPNEHETVEVNLESDVAGSHAFELQVLQQQVSASTCLLKSQHVANLH